MEMNEIVSLIVNNGVAIGVVAYFIFKDYQFNYKLISLVDKINHLIEYIERND